MLSSLTQEITTLIRPKLRLNLFGAPEVTLDGSPVNNLSVKAQALLFYLVTTRQSYLRVTLANLLWPEMPDRNAFANLRKAIQQLHSALPDHLTIERKSLSLREGAEIWVDVVAFEEQVQSAENVLDISKLEEAVQLYRGSYLTGFLVRNAPNFETWQLAQQARLHETALRTLKTLSQCLIAEHQFGRALEITHHMLELEPWREDAHRQVMELLAQDGRRHAALVQYEECRRLLNEEMGAPPSEETVRLYQRIRDGTYEGMAKPALSNAEGMKEVIDHPVPLPSSHLFGVDAARAELLAKLQRSDRPWLVSIDGIGGIGKTSLAQELVNRLAEAGPFTQIAWVSAKQEEFRAGFGIEPTGQAALGVNQLVDELLEQLTDQGLASTPQEKKQQLAQLLKEQPTLVVIDNLETVADYEALVPMLQELAAPSKFLITSRHALSGYGDVYRLTLGELSEENAFELLRHESTMRGIRGLSEANDDVLTGITAQITQVVGGHPLALNLVMGQLSFLPLDQVLTNLTQATGQQVDEFYTYIYWQAWQALSTAARELFMAMPMLHNASYGRLGQVSELGVDDLQSALAQLIGLSLVQVSGDLLEPRYRLHRLTETFLLNEVLKWDS